MHQSGMRKIAPKVILRIIVLVILIAGIISIVKLTMQDTMDDMDSGLYHTSLEYSYYSGEYGRLFSLLPDYDQRYSEELLIYTEMALVYRAYEKYVFWNDIVNRCEKDDENLEFYEDYRSQYLKELSRRMKTLEYEENRLKMDKIIRDAGIELV